ncbi:MAG: adenylate kinase [Ktedonobacteraceae bacterium]|nr:adenylate kinase [Ktedonobacteraceae bacterium]
MNIILIGAQGSGKGTQAEKLSATLHITHVASGDLFRQALTERSELGLKAKAYLDRGELVPDEITIAMVLERITQPDCSGGVLFDGFPRTVAQAQALDRGLQSIKRHVDLAIYLEVPREELLKRLSGRYICRAHQHVYNINTRPPRVPGICDIDGSELYQRSDDKGEAVEKRLNIFFNETIHLLDYYGAKGKLVTVNGNQGIEQVYAEMLHIIKERRERGELLAWQVPVMPESLPGQVSTD